VELRNAQRGGKKRPIELTRRASQDELHKTSFTRRASQDELQQSKFQGADEHACRKRRHHVVNPRPVLSPLTKEFAHHNSPRFSLPPSSDASTISGSRVVQATIGRCGAKVQRRRAWIGVRDRFPLWDRYCRHPIPKAGIRATMRPDGGHNGP
jgi:hypothetical protein